MKRLAIALCMFTSLACIGRDSTPECSPLLPALLCPTQENQLDIPQTKKLPDKFSFGTRGTAVKISLSPPIAEALTTLKSMLTEKMKVLFADKENVGPAGISLEKSIEGLIYYISTDVCYHSHDVSPVSLTVSALIWHIAIQITDLTAKEGSAYKTIQALLDNAIKELQKQFLQL